ncbi:MAG TPA: lipid II flippase MurJ [Thermoleophilaceae bacterium]|jgi:peptidoglycan biosynthesis protein MviN/MurJ (putative lipid II flippase)
MPDALEPTPVPAAAPGKVGRNAAITSVSQVATMAVGAVLALLVAVLVGNDARTDGFFAAYGVYSLAVVFAQAARTTVVARLLEGRTRFEAFDQYLGAALAIGLATAVVLGPLGSLVAGLLTGDLPGEAEDTARRALWLLAPAIVAQLFAGLGAAMLGALDDFLAPGLAFLCGGLVSIGVFVALEPSEGIEGLAIGLLTGSLVSAAAIAFALVRDGWRPTRAIAARPGRIWRSVGVLVIASLSLLIAHAGYLVALSVGGRLGEGVITAFSYSYLGFGLVQALIVASVPMVIIGPLAQAWDRRAPSLLVDNERVFRAGLLLLAPLVAAVWLVGQEVGSALLVKFSAGEIDLTVDCFLLLMPVVVYGLVQAVPFAALLVLGRYRAIAAATALVVAVQVPLSFLADALDSARMLAVAVAVANVANLVAAVVLVGREYPALIFPRVARALAVMAALAAAAFGIPAALLRALDVAGADWLALGAGLVAYAAAVAALLPVERDLAGRVLRAVVPARVAP